MKFNKFFNGKTVIGLFIIALIVAVYGGYMYFSDDTAKLPETQEEQVQDVDEFVKEFGSKLKNVSLTAPEAQAKEQIRNEYGKYVNPELLQYWMDNVRSAPGRYVSSPWPDRIEILEVRPGSTATSFTVIGQVVYMTSSDMGGDVGARQQVVFGIENKGGKLLITEYQGF